MRGDREPRCVSAGDAVFYAIAAALLGYTVGSEIGESRGWRMGVDSTICGLAAAVVRPVDPASDALAKCAKATRK